MTSCDVSPHFQLAFDASGFVNVRGAANFAAVSHTYSLPIDDVRSRFEREVPDRLADLVDLAQFVYVADRLCRRDNKRGAAWSRVFDIRVPVRDPAFWSTQLISSHLMGTLEFFTGDQWSLSFEALRNARQPRQMVLFPYHQGASRAALFSGGLDSFAGVVSEIESEPLETFLLVSATSSSRVEGVQRLLANRMRAMEPSRFRGCCSVHVGFRNRARRAERMDEKTQRSRGFVFSVLGAASAILSDINSLAIYENGVGAVNLPFTRAQLSGYLTRSTNPIGLHEVERLVSLVAGKPFHIHMPNLFLTKAELCNHLVGCERWISFIPDTISCDGFPQRIASAQQCGLCTSCLLRRQALNSAGLRAVDHSSLYRYDVYGGLDGVADDKMYPFRAMYAQVVKLRELLAQDSGHADLMRFYPELFEICIQLDMSDSFFMWPEERFADLYRRYCREWEDFPTPPHGSFQERYAE